MNTVKIAFRNVWGPSSDFTIQYWLQMFPYLAGQYNFVINDRDPDVVFYSVYGYHAKVNERAVRVLFCGEPGDWFAAGAKVKPGDPSVTEAGFFHYGLTMAAENTHPNHIYMPLMCLHLHLYNRGPQDLVRTGEPPPQKDFFCDFIYSNGNSQVRIDFFKKLSAYRRVESPGAVEHNRPFLAWGYPAKQAFQSRCKFSIAFENTYFPGYTSEKLSDPLVARSVPIYSGNPRVDEICSPHSFINADKFASHEEAIEYIKRVDQDEALYRSYIEEPPFIGNQVPTRFTDETYLAFWRRIFG